MKHSLSFFQPMHMMLMTDNYNQHCFEGKNQSFYLQFHLYPIQNWLEIVFCFDNCACLVWGKICPRLIWDFSKKFSWNSITFTTSLITRFFPSAWPSSWNCWLPEDTSQTIYRAIQISFFRTNKKNMKLASRRSVFTILVII